MCIEATCASSGMSGKPDSVAPPVYDNIQGRPINQTLLRIRSSLRDKAEKIQRYRERGAIADDDITLVAINVFDVAGGHVDTEDWFKRALFGFAGTNLVVCRETMKTVDVRPLFQTEIRKQSNGESVDVQPFGDGNLPGVSGVIAASTNVLNRDWPPARLGASMLLLPNATARIAYQPGLIPLGLEMVPSREADGGWSFAEVDHEVVVTT